MIFNRTLQDEDQDRLLWQKRPACNWDAGTWSGLSGPTEQLAPIKDLHGRLDTKEVRGVVMPVPEFVTDKMSGPMRQEELPPELTFTGTDRLGITRGQGYKRDQGSLW